MAIRLLLLSLIVMLSSCVKVQYSSAYISSAQMPDILLNPDSKHLFPLESTTYVDFDFFYSKFAFKAELQFLISNNGVESVVVSKDTALLGKKNKAKEYNFGFIAYATQLAYKKYGCHEFLYPNFFLKDEDAGKDNSFLVTDRESQVLINTRGYCIKLKIK